MKALVIGAGQVGLAIIGALVREKADVVAIDLNQRYLDHLTDTFDIQTICGSGADPGCLADAGVTSADMVVAVTNSDEVNMVASLMAAMKAPHSVRVARIRNAAYLKDPDILGGAGFRISHAINPELVTADRLVHTILVPFAVDAVPLTEGLVLVAFRVPSASPAVGRTFAQLRQEHPDAPMLVTSRERAGASIVPVGKDDVAAGDILYVVARPEHIDSVTAAFGLDNRPVRRVTIAGGSGIAAELAQRLQDTKGVSVKLIESDPARANELAVRLTHTLVISGEATEDGLLVEENIRDCDVFVASSRDEEANVMAALNAKRLGARRVMALTDKTHYMPIIESVGIDAVMSPRALAIGTILQHLRKGKVRNVTPFGRTGTAEIIQFEALETARIVGKPLREITMPPGCIIGALVRNGTPLIPSGSDAVQVGDHVFAFADHAAVKTMEKLFTVRLTFF